MKPSERFGENHFFEAVYAIEAAVHPPNLEGVYQVCMKVLKPEGIIRYSIRRNVLANSLSDL